MRILIIGGNGFVGSHLVDMLVANNATVRVLDRFPERFRAPNPKVDYRLGDFSDQVLLQEALDGIDSVIHLQSTTVPSTSERNSLFDIESNLIPTIKLLDLMVKMKCSELVYLSSGGAVYGKPTSLPVFEDATLRPISSYGIVKSTIEKYLAYYTQAGIRSLIVRPSNLYGTRQSNVGVLGLVNTLLEKIIHNESVIIYGDGTVVKDYIYIEDMTNFIQLAISKRLTGIYNMGSGVGISVNDVVALVEKVTERSLQIERQPVRSYDVDHVVLGIEKAMNHTGWKPMISLEEGIGKMWEYKISK